MQLFAPDMKNIVQEWPGILPYPIDLARLATNKKKLFCPHASQMDDQCTMAIAQSAHQNPPPSVPYSNSFRQIEI